MIVGSGGCGFEVRWGYGNVGRQLATCALSLFSGGSSGITI